LGVRPSDQRSTRDDGTDRPLADLDAFDGHR
jgi:hypothetical protein